MDASLQFLDELKLNFSLGGLVILNITLAFIMFGVALDVNLKDFRNIFTHPKSFITGLVSQFILLPGITFILVMILKVTPSVALGMLLVACCPGGNISNFITMLAKGNTALSVTLTGTATLGAIFITPLNFALWGNLYKQASSIIIPIEVDPWTMLRTVTIILGLPLGAGMLFKNYFPDLAQRIIKPFKVISILVFAGIVIVMFSMNYDYFIQFIHLIIFIVFIHNLLALSTGFSAASVMRIPLKDKRTITIETGIQNSGLALVLIFNPHLFDGLGGMAFVAAWWGIWHILAGLLIAYFFSRFTNPEG